MEAKFAMSDSLGFVKIEAEERDPWPAVSQELCGAVADCDSKHRRGVLQACLSTALAVPSASSSAK
jgi:hypothetical protein